MTVRARGTTYQADFMVKGTRYRETFDTHDEADRWEIETRHAVRMGKPLPAKRNKRTESGASLDNLGRLYLHVKAARWDRQKGGMAAIINGKQIVDFLGADLPVTSINKLLLEEACTHFFDNGNSQATVNRKMSAISTMLSEAMEHGVITKKPGIPHGKELANKIRFLTEVEEAKLVARFVHLGLEDWAHFTRFGVDTGARLGEIMGLAWDDFGPDHKTVHLWVTKSNKPRTVFLTKKAKAAVLTMASKYEDQSQGPWRHFRSKGILRRTLREQWDLTCNSVGIDKRIHDLRHTCASRLVQRGVDLLRVKDWLGHSDISTTLRYAHLAPNDLDACREALEK